MATKDGRPRARWILLAVGLLFLLVAWLLPRGVDPSRPKQGVETRPPAFPARPAPPQAPPPPPPAADPAAAAVPPPGPTSLVSGSVLDAEGHPAPGALVWAGDNPGPGGTRRDCDESGRYEMALPAGARTLRARGQGTGTASAEIAVPADGSRVEAPNLLLPAGGVIRGRTVDRDGKPLPWIRVRCWPEEGEGGEVLRGGRRFLFDGDDVVTDAKGEFRLRGLEPGPHRVFVELIDVPALKADPPEVTGVKPDGEPLLFRVMGAARLRGTVVDASTGDPIPCFSVAASVFDAADGSFQVEVGEEPEVEVAAPGYGTEKIPVAGEGDRRVALKAAEDSGTLVLLVSGEGGEPIPGLRAHVVTPDFHSWVRSWTAPAREFPFGRSPAGEVTIFLQTEGAWTPVTVTATVPKGGEARPEVKLRLGGQARVRILDARGNVAHYPKSAVLRDADGKGPSVRWIYTRPQGTLFTITEMQWTGGPEGTEMNLAEADGLITGLLPGTYRLEVSDGAVSKEEVFAIVAGGRVDVTVRLGK